MEMVDLASFSRNLLLKTSLPPQPNHPEKIKMGGGGVEKCATIRLRFSTPLSRLEHRKKGYNNKLLLLLLLLLFSSLPSSLQIINNISNSFLLLKKGFYMWNYLPPAPTPPTHPSEPHPIVVSTGRRV